jgi:hypothetical protein
LVGIVSAGCGENGGVDAEVALAAKGENQESEEREIKRERKNVE